MYIITLVYNLMTFILPNVHIPPPPPPPPPVWYANHIAEMEGHALNQFPVPVQMGGLEICVLPLVADL